MLEREREREKNRSSFSDCNKDTFISSPFFHVPHRTTEGRERTMSEKEDTSFSTGTTFPLVVVGHTLVLVIEIRQLSEYYTRRFYRSASCEPCERNPVQPVRARNRPIDRTVGRASCRTSGYIISVSCYLLIEPLLYNRIRYNPPIRFCKKREKRKKKERSHVVVV